MNNTRYRIAFVSRLAISALKQSSVLTGVSLCMVCGVLADDIAVSEQSFSCINGEKTHGCAPIPLDDQKIAELQGADLRCAKK